MAVLVGTSVAALVAVKVTAKVGALVTVAVATVGGTARVGALVTVAVAAVAVEIVAVLLTGSTITYPLVKSRRQAVPLW